MRTKILLLLTTLVISSTLWAQSAHKRYITRMTKDGMCYFFRATELSATEDISHFEYDITYLDWQDSITVNYTAYTSSPAIPVDLAITNGTLTYPCTDYKHLYVEFRKKGYEVRMTSRYALADFEQLLDAPQPLTFVFMQGNEKKSAAYKPKAWQKERNTIKQILQLIKSTR